MGLSSHFGRIFHEINHPFTLLVNVYIEKPMENHHAFFISWENSLYIYNIYIYFYGHGFYVANGHDQRHTSKPIQGAGEGDGRSDPCRAGPNLAATPGILDAHAGRS
jgi:hypothetical protein